MILDLIVLCALLVSSLISFMRGLIREVLTIMGVVGGLAASYFAGPYLRPVMRGWLGVTDGAEPQKLFDIIPYSILADALAYGLIFIVVVIVLSLLSHMVAEAARAVGLGPIDRILGVFFGLARGVFLIGLIYLPFSLVLDKDTKESWFTGSKTYIYIEQVSNILAGLIPGGTLDKIEDSARKAGEAGSETLRDKILNGQSLDKDQTIKQDDDAAEQYGPGYDPGFRKDMDHLFDQETPAGENP